MTLRWIGCLCSIGLSSASPLHTRQTNNSNEHSAKIIAPVVVVAVVCIMLVGFGWWKRRKRTQELIQQLQTPAANNTNNATNNTTTQTPATGADAPARPPRRRRRRRPSQISTKSLPAYNEQAGDEEIVLVRRAQRQSESDDDDSNENEDNGNTRPATSTASRAPDARPLLDDDSSPDMPRVSLASSTHHQSPNDNPEPQSQLGHESIANTTTVASSIAETEPEPEPTAVPQPHEVPSYTEAMSTSHVNLPTTTEHSAEPSGSTATDTGPPPTDADATVRPKRKSVFRHLGRFNISKPSGPTTTEAVEMTNSRTSTSTRPSISISGHRPSGSTSTHRPSTSLSAHRPSPSLSSLSLVLTRTQSPTMSRTSLNISAPIPTTLVRTELSYPRAGPTPEQIRFLSSRESLGRFGMPYGEQAIAAAKSRENLPPVYKPRVDASGSTSEPGAGTSGAGTSTSGAGENISGTSTQTEDLTIRRPLLTAGELAQQSANPSDPTDDRDVAVLDPAMTIQEEPGSMQDPDDAEVKEDEAIQSGSMNGDGDLPHENEDLRQGNGDLQRGNGDLQDRLERLAGQVEPRVRESPSGDFQDSRRESVFTTHSFVTATEGQGDSSPPTPTAETYQSQHQALAQTQTEAPARGQTVLIPESRDALHPELTLVPATPIG